MNIPFKNFIPGIAWFFLVTVLLFLPGNDLPSPYPWLDLIYFDKWVHFGLFGGMAFLFMWPVGISALPKANKIKWMIIIVVACIVWGIITEFIQLNLPGRSFSLADWSADIAGSFASFLFIKWLLRKRL